MERRASMFNVVADGGRGVAAPLPQTGFKRFTLTPDPCLQKFHTDAGSPSFARKTSRVVMAPLVLLLLLGSWDSHGADAPHHSKPSPPNAKKQSDLPGLLRAAKSLAREGKSKEALQQYRRLIPELDDPRIAARTWLEIGRLSFRLQKSADAVAAFEAALKLGARSPTKSDSLTRQALRGKFLALLQEEKYEEARELLTSIPPNRNSDQEVPILDLNRGLRAIETWKRDNQERRRIKNHMSTYSDALMDGDFDSIRGLCTSAVSSSRIEDVRSYLRRKKNTHFKYDDIFITILESGSRASVHATLLIREPGASEFRDAGPAFFEFRKSEGVWKFSRL